MKIAINGFGRIGRAFFRQVFGRDGFEVVAINDLSDVANLAYLLKYDTVYARYGKPTTHNLQPTTYGKTTAVGSLVVDKKEIPVFQEKDPANLPWKNLGVDVVVEATGFFVTTESAKSHLAAGAKRVIITAPAKDEATPTGTPGVNFSAISGAEVFSNASCTTNAVNPVVATLLKTIGIKKAVLNTMHAYTATQSLVDGIAKNDFRRGRAAAQNIVPSTTGASEATARAIPEVKDKFGGMAVRVPVVSGSLAAVTLISERPTTVAEVNDIFRKAAAQSEWEGIMKVVEDPITSADIIGEPYGAIVDLTLTQVVGGDLVEVFSWYDNEWGYCAMLVKQLEKIQNVEGRI